MTDQKQPSRTRKRTYLPHNPLAPLAIWIPKAQLLAEHLQDLRDRRDALLAWTPPRGWSIRQTHCRSRCPACPHASFSYRGLQGQGRLLSLAVAELSFKYRKARQIIEIQKKLDHYSDLSMRQVAVLSRDMPDSPRPEGIFTPIPYHLFAWKVIENNRLVLALQRETRDWNTENNRAHHDKVARQGALGFRIDHQQSGAFVPRWAIWVRGRMGQWIGAKRATPTFGKDYKDPTRVVHIPVRMTVKVCALTGNGKHKRYYQQQEKARSELVKKIGALSKTHRSLVQLRRSLLSDQDAMSRRGLLRNQVQPSGDDSEGDA
ncbi:hypothetical protein [Acidithiobacillus sp. AMEEHan]|uniref:hypothetical protein n=1 Tax=Acidithiobacillus sp. AMEEHan TaxID=2994951 RepID=UPI0027E4688C|nr:hypothetical protein [Acidithiobacillus sp. AMEEHan]